MSYPAGVTISRIDAAEARLPVRGTGHAYKIFFLRR